VFVLEGTLRGNLGSLQAMQRRSTNPKVHFLPVQGATHFSILAPINRLLAEKILSDNGPTCQITLSQQEVQQRFRR
jgi:hypothetical protein